jgi:translation initiation factor IF-2
MAVAQKKYKIFKICKELNLGHETVIEFLGQKKIKVSGLNASVSEDIYIEILDRFALDKEKAEELKARKKRASGEDKENIDSEEKKEETAEESLYLQALKKSIKDGVEALHRVGEEKKTVKKRKPKKAVQEVSKKAETDKEIEVKGKAVEEKTTAEKLVKDTDRAKVEEGKKKVGEYEDAKKKAASVEEIKKDGKEHIDELEEKKAGGIKPAADKKQIPFKKEKTKGKKPAGFQEEHLTEKEKKRRKALEMIRKDKDGKRGGGIGDTARIGEGVDVSRRRRKTKKAKRKQVDLKEVQNTIKKTLASIDSKGRKPKKYKKAKTENGEEVEEKIIKVTEFISVNDLANLMDVSVAEIITKCLELGLVVSINQRLEIDTITLLAEEYDFSVEEQFAAEYIEEEPEDEEEEDEANLVPRSPIVTIMGHVDHGKTSLLDFLRDSNVVGGESGGITQHIGAYEVDCEGKRITFLDTPGHEAFTAMRARGAQVTDIVILIIAADDAVMPQTDEALDHAKAAGVKIVIAINKIDKSGSNPEKIKQQLSERDVLVEDWGGTCQCAEISAKTGDGIPDLLEKLLLEAEMLDIKANPKRKAKGFIIESRLDKGKGAIATVLIQKGTLKIGDNFIAGNFYGKVRNLLNENEEKLKEVGPAQPALVVGFMGVPQAGDRFIVMKDEKSARNISTKRQQLKREQDAKQVKLVTLDQISERIKLGEVRDLPILVKADVDGSAEALADSLLKLNTEEVRVNVIRKAVGTISESDVLLASASGAVIIGFHIRANAKARELAEKENIDIRIYNIIYDAINDVKLALEGLLAPSIEENTIGRAEVRDTFKISRLGVIAGCYVLNGKISRKNKIRLVREDVEIYSGNIASLKRFKEDTREVASGFECGIQIENYNDLKVGDIIESFEVSSVKRYLE